MRRNGIDKTGEDAISYGYLFSLVFLILGSITILAVWAMENGMMDQINKFVAKGQVSSQTMNAIAFSRNITMALPIIAILGIFLWSMMRGVQSRDGYPPDSGSFYTGWTVLILCCIVSFLFSFLGGFVIDQLYTTLDKSHLIKDSSIMGAEWSAIQSQTMYGWINIYFGFCALVNILGIVVFFKSVVSRTVYSRYTG